MSNDTELKMNRRDFIAHMAKSRHVSNEDASAAYDMVIESIREVVESGYKLSLMGFGSFYLQKHRGHPVRFDDAGTREVKDYFVFKFSASNALNQHIRERLARAAM